MATGRKAARDLLYGRRAGRWAEDWTDEDEARYLADVAAKHAADDKRAAGEAQGDLFSVAEETGPDDT